MRGIEDGTGEPLRRATSADRAHVAETGRRDIGDDYAGAVIDGDRVVVLVVSDEARAAAERVRSRLRTADTARVDVVSPRMRRSALEQIKAEIAEQAPKIPHTIAFDTSVGRSDCPPIKLSISHQGREAELGRHWAHEVIARYGGDRVVVASDLLVEPLV